MRPEPRSGGGGDRDRAQPQSQVATAPRRSELALGLGHQEAWAKSRLPTGYLGITWPQPQFPLQREGAEAGLPCPAPGIGSPVSRYQLEACVWRGARVRGPHLPLTCQLFGAQPPPTEAACPLLPLPPGNWEGPALPPNPPQPAYPSCPGCSGGWK